MTSFSFHTWYSPQKACPMGSKAKKQRVLPRFDIRHQQTHPPQSMRVADRYMFFTSSLYFCLTFFFLWVPRCMASYQGLSRTRISRKRIYSGNPTIVLTVLSYSIGVWANTLAKARAQRGLHSTFICNANMINCERRIKVEKRCIYVIALLYPLLRLKLAMHNHMQRLIWTKDMLLQFIATCLFGHV